MNRILSSQIKDYLRTFLRPTNLIYKPQVVDKPPGDRVVVFSPHFDDDVISCGGTLYKHAAAGDEVTIIYFTDGREGDPDCGDKALVEQQRKSEAKAATQLLGIHNLVFLDQPETKLKATSELCERLAGLLYQLRPNLVYLPSFLDNHIDHFEVNRVLLALASRIDWNFTVCAYEGWTPLLPNLVVDITAMIAVKEEALKQFHSQLKYVDYVRVTLALNACRTAMNLRGKGYAEAFFCVPVSTYLHLLKRSGISLRPFLDFDRAPGKSLL